MAAPNAVLQVWLADDLNAGPHRNHFRLAGSAGRLSKNCFARNVVRVDFKRQGKPEINVGKEHRPAILATRPSQVQCARMVGAD